MKRGRGEGRVVIEGARGERGRESFQTLCKGGGGGGGLVNYFAPPSVDVRGSGVFGIN